MGGTSQAMIDSVKYRLLNLLEQKRAGGTATPERPMSATSILIELGLPIDSRVVRDVVHVLREEGEWIGAKDGRGGGYWSCVTQAEAEVQVAKLTRQAYTQLKAAEGMKRRFV